MTAASLPDSRETLSQVLRPRTEAERNQLLCYGTFAVLLLAPLAFGAVEPWSAFALQAAAAGLFLFWAWKQIRQGEMYLRWNPLFAPMLAWAALIALQLALGTTAYRYATGTEALLYVSYGLLCFLAIQSLNSGKEIGRLAAAISGYGLLVAFFALVHSLSSNGKLYWLRTPRSGGWIYGPYVNHNHYAGLMELLVPIPLVLCLSRRVRRGPKMFFAAAALVMASTIFLSGSRGGVAAFLVQFLGLALYVGTRRRSPRLGMALGGFVLLGGLVVLWLGGSTITDRLATIHSEARTEISGGIRTQIARDGLHMFRERPVLGWGLGTFPTVYPRFRTFYTNLFVNQAHNDYVQLLAEMGVLGGVVALWFLFLLFRHALAKLPGETLGTSGGMALACLLGCTGILVHSFVDFNLQIPANAALFYVFATLAASERLRENSASR
jgi:O-antigen ligase